MECEVRTATPDEFEDCFRIRRRVFVDEQGVSRDEEFDDLDASCVHFIARQAGRTVGTARLDPRPDGAQAQRVAVLADVRRQGIGAQLMAAIELEARQRGIAQVVLHAQTSAIAFYESIGYAAEGEVFEEAAIPHRLMRKALAATTR